MRGFSLMETLILLAVLGIFTVLGLPLYKPYKEFSLLKRNTWVITSDLRAYRQQAILDHFNYRFVFNTANESYTVKKYTYPGNTFVADMKTENLTLDLVSATDFWFEPQGNANIASSIELRNNINDSTTITVASSTGNVKIQ